MISFLLLGSQEFKTPDGAVGAETSYLAYPITLQGRYFIKGAEEGGIYVGGRIGFVSATVEVTVLGLKADETESGFIVVPEVGFRKGKFQANVSFSFTGVETETAFFDENLDSQVADLAWLGIGAAYLF